MTMLTDGIKSKSLEDKVKQLDVAELLEKACDVATQKPEEPVMPPPVEPGPPQPEATAE
jgi:hypothetical protein